MSNVAILVQSSDDYAFCWPEWRYWYERFFPRELYWRVNLVSHTKQADWPWADGLCTGRVDFSEQLICALKNQDAPDLLYWQVDYWPDGPVCAATFAELYGLFKREAMDHLRVCYRSQDTAVRLQATPLTVWERPVWKLADDSARLVTHQIAFWTKAALLKTLVSGESAYEHENNGSQRMKGTGFYACQYILQWYCHGVSKGQYVDAYESMQGLKRCTGHT